MLRSNKHITIMGQINIKKGNQKQPPAEMRGFGFDDNGKPIVILEDGTTIELNLQSEISVNVIANKGVGTEANLPTEANIGDIYVSNDTFTIFTRAELGLWSEKLLTSGQIVTDVINGRQLPPVYQYYDGSLMPIANYEETPPGTLPE